MVQISISEQSEFQIRTKKLGQNYSGRIQKVNIRNFAKNCKI